MTSPVSACETPIAAPVDVEVVLVDVDVVLDDPNVMGGGVKGGGVKVHVNVIGGGGPIVLYSRCVLIRACDKVTVATRTWGVVQRQCL
jgi:hypothetical protein